MNQSKYTKHLATLCLLAIMILSATSCTTTSPKLKADVIGFSDDVKTSYNLNTDALLKAMRKQDNPYDLLRGDKRKMQSFIIGLTDGNNTASYYALDLALDRINYVRKKKDIMGKDPNSKYYIITLTDGLDNVSTTAAKNNNQGSYSTPDEYISKLQEKMQSISEKCDFTAYCIAYKGDDLKNTQLQNNKTDDEFNNASAG